MVEMKDSWFTSKKKQLDVQHHRERFKTRMIPVWKLTVEIITINKLKRTQVCQSTTHCSKTTHLDQEFKRTGRSAQCSNYQVERSYGQREAHLGNLGSGFTWWQLPGHQSFGFFLPSTSFANLQPLLQLRREGKGTNAACEAQSVFSMIAKTLLIQRHVCMFVSNTIFHSAKDTFKSRDPEY